MSAYDKVINVKSLLSNTTTSSFSTFSKLIQDSRNKVASILSKHSGGLLSNYLDNHDNLNANKINNNYNNEIQDDDIFKSMTKLTNFVLYDNKDYNSSCNSNNCNIFNLNDKEKSELEYFSREIDSIQDELIDLNENIKSYNESYKRYCENFLKLCDQKDELFEMFLDYYEEYFINDENSLLNESLLTPQPAKQHQNERPSRNTNVTNKKRKSSKSNKPNHHLQLQPIDLNDVNLNTTSITTTTTTNTTNIASNNNNNNSNNNNNHYQSVNVNNVNSRSNKKRSASKIARRNSILYMYSVPTENRFSILSKAAAAQQDGQNKASMRNH
jgi:hypothetical protein